MTFIIICTVMGVASVMLCCNCILQTNDNVPKRLNIARAYLLGPNRSALLTSSETIAKKSFTWSVEAP